MTTNLKHEARCATLRRTAKHRPTLGTGLPFYCMNRNIQGSKAWSNSKLSMAHFEPFASRGKQNRKQRPGFPQVWCGSVREASHVAQGTASSHPGSFNGRLENLKTVTAHERADGMEHWRAPCRMHRMLLSDGSDDHDISGFQGIILKGLMIVCFLFANRYNTTS